MYIYANQDIWYNISAVEKLTCWQSPNLDQSNSLFLASTHIQLHFHATCSAHFSVFCGYICLGEKWARTFPWASTCRQELDLLPRMPHRGTLSPALSRQNRWNTEGRREERKRARWSGEVTAILDCCAPERGREVLKMQRKKRKGQATRSTTCFQHIQFYMNLCRRCRSSCFQTFWLHSPKYKVTPTHLPTPKLQIESGEESGVQRKKDLRQI